MGQHAQGYQKYLIKDFQILVIVSGSGTCTDIWICPWAGVTLSWIPSMTHGVWDGLRNAGQLEKLYTR